MVGILTAVFFLLMVGFFAGSEMALISANKARLRHLKRMGSKGARIATEMLSNPEIFLTTILVGTNLSLVACTFVATGLLERAFGDVGKLGSTFIVAFAILVIGEIVPKSFARHLPERFGMVVSPILVPLRKILFPLIVFSNWGARGLMAIFGARYREAAPIVSRVAFRSAVQAGEDEGILGARDRRIISTVLDFWRKPVREIMVPRMEMVCAPVETGYEEMAQVLAESGHSRIPVFEGSVDNIKGVVVAVDMLEREGWHAGRVMRPIRFVPEEKNCATLLDELRRDEIHTAIVVDEHGGTKGLVSLEDLVEELIGEIRDEHDREIRAFEKIARRVIVADGNARLADIEKQYHISLPKGEYETVGGLVIDAAGEIPKAGSIFRFGDISILVMDSSDRKVEKVRIRVSSGVRRP